MNFHHFLTFGSLVFASWRIVCNDDKYSEISLYNKGKKWKRFLFELTLTTVCAPLKINVFTVYVCTFLTTELQFQ